MKYLTTLWLKLKSKFGKPVFKIQTGHHVELAFISDGVEYFHFTDTFNIPCERGLDALAVYEEMNMRCTREYLLAHTEAFDKIFKTQGSINITEIIQLNNHLKERLQFIHHPEIIYKLASIMYFDKSESPYRYDNKYAEEKIKKWKKQKMMDFFLLLPIKNLIPSLQQSEQDFDIISQVMQKMDKAHLENLISILSSKGQRPSSGTALQYLKKQVSQQIA